MPTEPLYLGIDFGTSVFKAGLYTSDGSLRGLGKSELTLDVCNYEAGRFELTANSFWVHVRACIDAALLQSGADLSNISGISYASQANSFILLDKGDEPLCPFILWPDQRGATEMEAFRFRWERDVLLKVLGVDAFAPEMAVSKLRWFQKEDPETWAKVCKIQTLCEYFVYSLTGQAVGDRGTAALMGLWNQPAQRWWPEMLEYFNLHEEQLSVPLMPGSCAGKTKGTEHRHLDLPDGIPVFVGSLDHHVGGIVPIMTFGAGVSVSLGTVVAAIRFEPKYLPERHLILGPHFGNGGYYRLAFSNFGASWLKRLKDETSPNESWEAFLERSARCPAAELDDLAVDVEASLADNRLVFNGVGLHHKSSHYTAAVLSAIVGQIKQLTERVCGDVLPPCIGICGGGTQNPVWENRLRDVLGVEIVSVPGAELGCLGAALLAVAGVEKDSIENVARRLDLAQLADGNRSGSVME